MRNQQEESTDDGEAQTEGQREVAALPVGLVNQLVEEIAVATHDHEIGGTGGGHGGIARGMMNEARLAEIVAAPESRDGFGVTFLKDIRLAGVDDIKAVGDGSLADDLRAGAVGGD